MCLLIWICISFSTNFEIGDNKAIGLKFETSVLSPLFLYRGKILFNFHLFGHLLVLIHWFIRWVTGCIRASIDNFMTLLERPFRSSEPLLFKSLNSSRTLLGVTSWSSKISTLSLFFHLWKLVLRRTSGSLGVLSDKESQIFWILAQKNYWDGPPFVLVWW